jgi:hypothetical protein
MKVSLGQPGASTPLTHVLPKKGNKSGGIFNRAVLEKKSNLAPVDEI